MKKANYRNRFINNFIKLISLNLLLFSLQNNKIITSENHVIFHSSKKINKTNYRIEIRLKRTSFTAEAVTFSSRDKRNLSLIRSSKQRIFPFPFIDRRKQEEQRLPSMLLNIYHPVSRTWALCIHPAAYTNRVTKPWYKPEHNLP